MFLRVTLNRASLGTSENVFALIHVESENSHPRYVAYVPRRDILVDEQPVINEELTGRLRVHIVARDDSGEFLVETRNDGRTVRLKATADGELKPIRLVPRYEM